ncbi:Acetyltransferase (GNAT) domain-containing protein [Bizionia echini]|uniref:Acetyltransferase (GNAT) domain-containing protein n=1 Tax=Bizionia echini TaxID=649333 RepID=A0A1I5AZL0_9FLAO|nr:GNAT family N-acetyltransferase [Bizionia echini]SFN67884.1 Acetyltransferase (GNAT) domain-containing protein [Bizionia echini]
MKHNPFTSKTYQETWLKYFAKQKTNKRFQCLENLSFIKHRFLPYYINAGKNMTNGITYSVNPSKTDLKNHGVVIYDVPDYCDTSSTSKNESLKIHKVAQYKGFLADLSQVDSFEDYLQNTLNAKSRNKFRSTLKKFENCFDVTYKYYYGAIDKEDYHIMMTDFKNLVENRYGDLKIDTSLIREWPFYEELVYKMLHEKKAMIISINIAGKPISMSLGFLSETALVGAVKAFDTNYYKFNVGHIEISKFIEWCIAHNKRILDFSKGEYEYKTKWTNTKYLYNCHVVYNNSSVTSKIIGFLLVKYFELKQYLRDKKINLLVAKARFALKNIGTSKQQKLPFKIQSIQGEITNNDYQLTSLDEEVRHYPFLKRIVMDGLYQKPESYSNIKLFKSTDSIGGKPSFVVMGSKSKYLITIF